MRRASALQEPAATADESRGVSAMALRAFVVRGLAKEVEEDLNKFLTSQEVRILHMAQSESGDHISITLIVEDPDPLS